MVLVLNWHCGSDTLESNQKIRDNTRKSGIIIVSDVMGLGFVQQFDMGFDYHIHLFVLFIYFFNSIQIFQKANTKMSTLYRRTQNRILDFSYIIFFLRKYIFIFNSITNALALHLNNSLLLRNSINITW